MKSIRTIAALAAVFGLGSYAQAGFGLLGGCGASKCCDCAPTSQPSCCRPTIVRPCHRNVYNYQRTCAKPMCCDTACAPATACGPSAGACADTGAGACGPGNACATGPACAAPCHGAGNGNGCAAPCDPGCAAPCDPGCAAPCDPGCAAPCDPGCCDNGCLGGAKKCGLFGHKWGGWKKGCLFGKKTGCCETACDECCAPVCNDACEIAELIYCSQTACYARQRAAAIHKLGDRYDCVCHPEIMSAFIYALNDADERVRRKAADEIGDQVRRNGCCCSPCVVAALTNALADCDRGVRREAEQALCLCGYDVVDGCCDQCDVACNDACGNACGTAPAVHAAPAAAPAAPMDGAAPAPAPPQEPKAYSPKASQNQLSSRKSLSNLFGMVR